MGRAEQAPRTDRVDSSARAPTSHRPTVTVVVACYDEKRLDLTLRCVRSVMAQNYPHQLVVVVDHNQVLADRLLAELPPEVEIVQNSLCRGASGARNTVGLEATTDLLAFLDDDAHAAPDWLARLVQAMEIGEDVVGAGGQIEAEWQGRRPAWFPSLFGWVVGASIEPALGSPVDTRNVWSGNMIVDAGRFKAEGGFRQAWGKVGGVSEPEDTELSLRLAGERRRWLFVPSAVVHHIVPQARSTLSYFFSRCWAEGRGKARLHRLMAGAPTALASERHYLTSRVPNALLGHAREVLRGDPWGAARAMMCLAGSTWTAVAFASELPRGQRGARR